MVKLRHGAYGECWYKIRNPKVFVVRRTAGIVSAEAVSRRRLSNGGKVVEKPNWCDRGPRYEVIYGCCCVERFC